jgi:DNA repair protein RecN (Recombination protein N)
LLERARDLGLARKEDAELLVTRSVSREGRGKVFINGTLATVSLLSELLSDALEVVSQGEHQRLLRPEVQAQLLDAYGELGLLVEEVASLHARWHALAKEIHARRASAEERARREDQLRFELEQIEAVDPEPDELESLEAEHARLAHVDRLGQELGAALELLDGGGGARERLDGAQAHLHTTLTLDNSLSEIAEAAERAQLELTETVASLERYLSLLESDPARLAQVETRLTELRRLQSRYGPTIEAILAYRDGAREELELIGGGEARTAAQEAEQAELAGSLEAVAKRLEKARRQVAGELELAVARELAAVGLGRVSFRVAFEPLSGKTREGWEAPCAPQGRERASFWLAANPGEDPRRLRDAASGGELARLLLALRNVLREEHIEEDMGGVLLFDEIDAGVGGRTARRVGERLRWLAARHQILCITHLPQIAAVAQAHYRVEKRLRSGRTLMGVKRLVGDARVDEIARMAAGGRVTETARAHARELLAR